MKTALLLICLSITSYAVGAQSGRGWMHGTVVDNSTSKAIASATVELVDDQDSVTVSTTTDEKGVYSIKSVPMGDYKFRVRAEGYEAYEKKIDIVSDGLTEVDVRLKKK